MAQNSPSKITLLVGTPWPLTTWACARVLHNVPPDFSQEEEWGEREGEDPRQKTRSFRNLLQKWKEGWSFLGRRDMFQFSFVVRRRRTEEQKSYDLSLRIIVPGP